jgi:hypothetical protein
MDTGEIKIPTVNELDAIFRNIDETINNEIVKNIDAPNLHKIIYKYILDNLKCAIEFNRPYDTNIIKASFFRLREDNGFDNTQIHEFSYTPVAYSNNYNRANIPKHPVFIAHQILQLQC